MQNLLGSIMAFPTAVGQGIFDILLQWPPLFWGLCAWLLITFLVVGQRLGRFTHPGYPRGSHLVRFLATFVLIWPAAAALLVFMASWVIVLLVALHYGTFDGVWMSLEHRGVAVGVGVFISSISAVWLVLGVIPNLERPRKTAASADVILNSMSNFDPEQYFRV